MILSIKGRDEAWDVTDLDTGAVIPEVRVTVHFVDGNKHPVADVELEDGTVVRDCRVRSVEYVDVETPRPATTVALNLSKKDTKAAK